MSRSSAPVPHRGGRVDDGTGIAPGFIPDWLARIVYARLLRIAAIKNWRVMPFEDIVKMGGFLPLEILDLLAGGKGDGLAWIALEKRQYSILDQAVPVEIEIVKTMPKNLPELGSGKG